MDTETKNETKKVVVTGERSGPGGREVGAYCVGLIIQ